ncbi:MAG: perilipin family protein [Muribaculaceae bacterium]|nr:perilipin family protein [Muribaculaceae bacterium]
MATYTSKPQKVERSAEELFARFSDLSHLQSALDTLTDEQRAQVGEVQFTADSISIVTPQVGEIAFHVTDRIAPSKVVFGTKSSPVPLTMEVDIKALSETASEVQTVINVEIPAMLRPLIGPQLQKAADKFGELMAGLSR